jgi:hypothetical protein
MIATLIPFHRVLALRLVDDGPAIAVATGGKRLVPQAWQKRAPGTVATPHWGQYFAESGADEFLRMAPALSGNAKPRGQQITEQCHGLPILYSRHPNR